MTNKEAYLLGYSSGSEAVEHGDFSPEELADEELFEQACHEICSNKRQYAYSPTYDFAKKRNSDLLFDAFDQGEADAITEAIEEKFPTK